MSQENVEIVRRLYESGAVDGNYDALREALDPEAVYVNPPEAVDPGTRRGVDEIVAAAENVSKSFGATKHELRELFDAGDAVVASVTAHAWGRDSGAQVTQEEAHTWTFRDGKVISFEWSRDLPGALGAVGLSEQPMSQENVELLHRWRESWARQDVDAAAGCLHNTVEVDFSAARGPFRGVYLGPAEAIQMWRTVWEAWGEVVIDFAEVIDCEDGRVITVNVFRAQGRTSGIPTEARVANLWAFRDGLISRIQMFQSKDQALEAVGLSE